MKLGRDNEALQDFPKLDDIIIQVNTGNNNLSEENNELHPQSFKQEQMDLIEKLSAIVKISLSEL